MASFQKIITGSILIVVVGIFLRGWNIHEYRSHHITPTVSGEQIFLTSARAIAGPIGESWMIDMIDKAQEKVWISVYTFTLPSLRASLVRAQKRGVDVRVILEKFPFGNTDINRETVAFLRGNTIPLHQSSENQFAFMHAKYALIDTHWIIETANWTRASFSSNREFFIISDDPSIHESLSAIFEGDFSGGVGRSTDIRLLAGPTNARERFTEFLHGTQSALDIYASSFSDKALIKTLENICLAGKTVRVLLADHPDSAKDLLENSNCIRVHLRKKPLHAKALIRDRQSAFVGSFNYTDNSLENNREIGLFLSGEVTKSISEVFDSDWKSSEVALR